MSFSKITDQRMKGLVGRNSILKLSAYLTREVAGLDDWESVTLSSGPVVVRSMAAAARDDMDRFRSFVRSASEIVADFGVCSSAGDGGDTCSGGTCPYCDLVCLVNEASLDA